ncbi:MAG: PilZ domain-containing protein [Candidatus Omnitrophica bacterium]|nr:PilZ domain-containing protein [Candidatus Omnitrophota bacterium]
MQSDVDRRMFDRIDGIVAVKYCPEGSTVEHYATTKNISGGGIRMSLFRKLEPGTVLELEIYKMNSNVSARCRGEVIWITRTADRSKRCFEAGIKFLGLNFVYIGELIKELGGYKHHFFNAAVN